MIIKIITILLFLLPTPQTTAEGFSDRVSGSDVSPLVDRGFENVGSQVPQRGVWGVQEDQRPLPGC